MKRFVILYFLSIGLWACDNSNNDKAPENNLSSEVYNSLLGRVLDSIDNDNLRNKTLYLIKFENPQVIQLYKETIINSSNENLTKFIRHQLADTLDYNFNQNLNLTNYNIRSITSNSIKEISQDITFNANSNKAMVNLSPLVYDRRKKLGAFFISIKTHSKVNNYMVYVHNLKDKWEVLKIFGMYGTW